MDIDKLIPASQALTTAQGFGSLMDIDKLIPAWFLYPRLFCFGSLMDIDKLIQDTLLQKQNTVLVH